jgi:hypothetical protein
MPLNKQLDLDIADTQKLLCGCLFEQKFLSPAKEKGLSAESPFL